MRSEPVRVLQMVLGDAATGWAWAPVEAARWVTPRSRPPQPVGRWVRTGMSHPVLVRPGRLPAVVPGDLCLSLQPASETLVALRPDARRQQRWRRSPRYDRPTSAARSASTTRDTATGKGSCSHTRTGLHPAARSRKFVSASRSRLRPILPLQYSAFVAGSP